MAVNPLRVVINLYSVSDLQPPLVTRPFLLFLLHQQRSHLVEVGADQRDLRRALVGTPILGDAGNFNEFGVDPNVDPELAMVRLGRGWKRVFGGAQIAAAEGVI